MYPKHSKNASVQASPSFPDLEREVLEYWEQDGTFQQSINQRVSEDAEEFVFYDGPPFANGLPHYGHLLTGYTKDLVPRYQTMRGKRVERRFGWDTHGLPAEVEAERLLGISGRPEIEKFGVAKFNEFCKTSLNPVSGLRAPTRTGSQTIGAVMMVSKCGLASRYASSSAIFMTTSVTSSVSLFLNRYVGIMSPHFI